MASKGPGTSGFGIFARRPAPFTYGRLANGHDPTAVVTDRGYVAPDLEVRLMERINRDFLTIHDFNAVGSHNKSVLESDFGVIIEKLKSLEAALSEEREKSASLTARIEKLEAEHLRFTGTWQREAEYVEGDLAQHAGSLWLATLPSIGQCPGQTPTWRLLVKRGSLK